MNYLKIYETLINTAKQKNRRKVLKSNINYQYYEMHHVIPKCIGGTNEKDNLVLLTAKEHFLAHKLLTYIHKNVWKINNAFCRLAWDKNINRNVSARDYAYSKELRASIPMPEHIREKMRKPHGPMSDEHKANVSNAIKGRKDSEETKARKKIANSQPRPKLKGKPTWNAGLTANSDERMKKLTKNSSDAKRGKSINKGHVMSDEQKEKLRTINTGKKQSQETINKRMTTMKAPWNKGLSKETDERLKLAGEKIRKKNSGN